MGEQRCRDRRDGTRWCLGLTWDDVAYLAMMLGAAAAVVLVAVPASIAFTRFVGALIYALM